MRQDVFKSASELGIEPRERNALICFLNDLEANAVRWFSMDSWRHCIAGQCDILYGTNFVDQFDPAMMAHKPLFQLFAPPNVSSETTQAAAAIVLRHYLMTGQCIWGQIGTEIMLPKIAQSAALEMQRRSTFDLHWRADGSPRAVIQDAVA